MSLIHLLALIACAPEAPLPAFEMAVGPSALSMDARVGDCATDVLQVHNTGTLAASATLHPIVHDCAVVAWDAPASSVWLSPGGRASLPVRYCPEVPGSCDAVLPVTLHTDAGELETVQIALSGVATSPDDDGDGFRLVDGDCDDTAADVNPGAVELVNGVDDDCDGRIDDGTEVYDDDGDGFAELDGDCDDADSDRHPAASERPDGVDQDCDGLADEGTELFDDDGDGWMEAWGDCNDWNADVYPGRAELPDGVDQDCDGLVDEGTDLADDDGDGVTEAGGDCDDANPGVHPGAIELADGVDQDCDGAVDEATSLGDDDGDGFTEAMGDCNDGNPEVYPMREEVWNAIDDDCNGRIDDRTEAWDDDGDGMSELAGDCDDADPAVRPGALEQPDGVDQDCDGLVDEGTALADDDGDGFTELDGDCQDMNALVYPGAFEWPADGIDHDCDGSSADGPDAEVYPGGTDLVLPPDFDFFAQATGGCAVAALGQYGAYDPPLVVPVTLVRLRDGAGVPAASSVAEARAALALASRDFQGLGISFEIVREQTLEHSRGAIDPNDLAGLMADYGASTGAADPRDAILIFVGRGDGIAGAANHPRGVDQAVFVDASVLTPASSTLSHELGHYFGLFHPHEGTWDGSRPELADGSNCATAGDLVCDTPADPGPVWHNPEGCVENGCSLSCGQDAEGDTYSPRAQDLMSYYPDSCDADGFTTQQVQRMRCQADAHLDRLIAQAWVPVPAPGELPPGAVCGLRHDPNRPATCLGHDPEVSCPAGYLQREGGDRGMPSGQGYGWCEAIGSPDADLGALPAGLVCGLEHTTNQQGLGITCMGHDAAAGDCPAGFTWRFGGDAGMSSGQGYVWCELDVTEGCLDDTCLADDLPELACGLGHDVNDTGACMGVSPTITGSCPAGFAFRAGGDQGLSAGSGFDWCELQP